MSLNPEERRRRISKSPGRAPSPPDGYSPPRSSRYAEPKSSRYYDDDEDDDRDRKRGDPYDYDDRSSARAPREPRDRDDGPRYAEAPYRPPASHKKTASFAMPGGFSDDEEDPKISKYGKKEKDYYGDKGSSLSRRDDSPPPRDKPRYADPEPDSRYKRDVSPAYKPRYAEPEPERKPRYAEPEPERKLRYAEPEPEQKPKSRYKDESPPSKSKYDEPDAYSKPRKYYDDDSPPRRPKYAAPDSPPQPKYAAPVAPAAPAAPQQPKYSAPEVKPKYVTADPTQRGGNPKYWEDKDSDSDSDDSDEQDGPTGDRRIDIDFELKHDHYDTTVRKREKHKHHHESPKYNEVALVTTTTDSSRYAEPKRWEYAHPEEKITYTSKTESYTANPGPESYGRPAYDRPYAPPSSGRQPDPRAPVNGPGQTQVVTVEPGRRNRAPSNFGPGGLAPGGAGMLGVAGAAAAGASLANAPGSPMLEAYKGTYQSMGPLTITSKPYADNGDVDILEIAPPVSPTSKRRHARFHDLENEASILKKALRETKSKTYPDTGPFIEILPALTHEQILDLRAEYKKQVKTPDMKGVNVAKHIKVRLKEDRYFLKACYATALGRWESEAYWANSYYQGSQTSRELLIESLMGRTNAEIRQIKEAFRDKKYSDSLTRCMKQELKEDKFKKAVMMVLEEKRMDERPGRSLDRSLVEQDVRDLNRAIKSERGGESVMIGIIVQRSDSHIREILRVYEASFRSNFAREMLKKSGNLVGEMLAHILNGIINRPVRDTLLLHHALTLTKSDSLRVDLLISRLVRYHWDRPHMEAIKREYRTRYGKELQEAVREGTKGAWGEFCEELCVKRVGDEVKRFDKVERIERVERIEVHGGPNGGGYRLER
ncbi:hypothetical protein VE02_03340 [Pseudogymnoascus sp. 03VT05]|nr:hypothetical protein VE02_03340 [Pseudogymnoascus sp. 03VT05]